MLVLHRSCTTRPTTGWRRPTRGRGSAWSRTLLLLSSSSALALSFRQLTFLTDAINQSINGWRWTPLQVRASSLLLLLSSALSLSFRQLTFDWRRTQSIDQLMMMMANDGLRIGAGTWFWTRSSRARSSGGSSTAPSTRSRTTACPRSCWSAATPPTPRTSRWGAPPNGTFNSYMYGNYTSN